MSAASACGMAARTAVCSEEAAGSANEGVHVLLRRLQNRLLDASLVLLRC